MNIKNMFFTVVLGLVALSSNHSQGATAAPPSQSAQLFVTLIECILFILPTTAFLLIVWSRWKHLRFKQLLQTALNSSLLLMLMSLVTVSLLAQSISPWIIVLASCHVLLVGVNYLLVKQHTNRVKNTLTGCW
ncbi:MULTISPECIES: hypothetical protein [unclassified Pseudoalteromonas]|jgi:hypothetical protein|uniref:hypothetical protein n=1 Tax=unclassified Pseudoalteromonas TaxID=194690 RepID=UPI001F2C0687|nr:MULTISPECIES: hypothetical protein [unclassified Pseudoalteromonas]MCF2901503.1 hypothetical protein [Pseudoalteromonas sp. OFAV1]MCO7252102.1 hypothetical protein [Pseudoalteromonas sp. Ps84H-4]